MSWEHAMTVARILDRIITEYERQVPSLAAMRAKLIEAEAELRTAQGRQP
jgi:hypothetical protein